MSKTEKSNLLQYKEIYTPIYNDIVEITKKHERAHWTSDEIKMQIDVEQWNVGAISKEEKALIKNILRLFTQSDVNVGTGYIEKLIPYIKNNEARGMLISFCCREFEHQRAYALLSDTLGFGEDFYFEFLEYQDMKEKHEFMLEQIEDSIEGFAKYLAKQIMIEGVCLFASFAILLNFDRMGKLPAMCDVVRWSMIDESIHIEGNSLLFKHFTSENPKIVNTSFKKEIHDTITRIVELEDVFIDKSFEVNKIHDLTSEDMKKYVRYVSDYRLRQIGIPPIWKMKKNPLPWVDYMMGSTFGNFFEREIVEYSKANMVGEFKEGYFKDKEDK
ncbi:ribonucleotide-diphosphate reductase subunit beta [Rickettsiales bacterium LUAb2]